MCASPIHLLTLTGLIAATIGGSGCNQAARQAELKMLETRELDLSYDEAYKAATNGLFALGYTIDHSDKESGILTGKKHDPNTGGKIAGAMLLGVVGLLAAGENDEAVTFMLSCLDPETTQLRMKVVVNGKPVTDRTVMTRIWQQIEREAMLDSGPANKTPRTTPAANSAGP